MRGNPKKVKRFEDLIAEHGFTLSEVIRKEMGMSLSAFADKHEFARTEVSMTVNGHTHRIYPQIRKALGLEVGLTEGELDRLIDYFIGSKSKRRSKRRK